MWCSTSSRTCSPCRRPQTDAPAAAARVHRSKPRPAAAVSAAARSASLTRATISSRGRAAAAAGSLAAAPRAGPGTRSAGSRGARPGRQAPPPAPRVERPAQPHRQRDRCRCRRALPDAPGTTAAAAHRTARSRPGRGSRHQRRTRRPPPTTAAAPAPPRSAPRTGCGSALDVQRRPDPADQPRRQQRVPAELEEVVVDADPLDAQHLGKQPAQDLLLRRPRRRRRMRRRQAPAPAAPGGRACRSASAAAAPAPPAPTAPCSPAAVRPAMPASAEVSATLARRRHHIADQPLVRRRVLPRDHRGLRHARCRSQRRLDLARLDPEAAQLHLRVGPAQELQHAVRDATAPGPRSGTSGSPPGPCGSATNRSAVSPAGSDSRAPSPTPAMYSSPDNPRRHRLKTAVQHIGLRVPDRTADRNVAPSSSSCAGCSAVASIEASVGPYRLMTQPSLGRCLRDLSRSRHGSASPLQMPGAASARSGACRQSRSDQAGSNDGTK